MTFDVLALNQIMWFKEKSLFFGPALNCYYFKKYFNQNHENFLCLFIMIELLYLKDHIDWNRPKNSEKKTWRRRYLLSINVICRNEVNPGFYHTSSYHILPSSLVESNNRKKYADPVWKYIYRSRTWHNDIKVCQKMIVSSWYSITIW